MGRKYKISHTAIAVAGAITIMQLKAGASNICYIRRLEMSQTGSTTSAQVRVQIVRKSAAATVTSFTPLLLDTGDSAAKSVGGTAATGVTATAEGTDTDIVLDATWNALSGYLYVPTPDELITVPAGGIIGVKFPANPALTISANLFFEEVGG
jgi:hypothetical protein